MISGLRIEVNSMHDINGNELHIGNKATSICGKMNNWRKRCIV